MYLTQKDMGMAQKYGYGTERNVSLDQEGLCEK